MSSQEVLLSVEDPPGGQITEVLFEPECKAGLVRIDAHMTTSGAMGVAGLYLLRHWPKPVALLINTGTTDGGQVNDIRASAERVLGRRAPDNWHVAVAVPRLYLWPLLDPHVRQAAEEEGLPERRYSGFAAWLKGFTRTRPLDREVLRRECPEFRDLLDFLHRAAHAPEPARR